LVGAQLYYIALPSNVEDGAFVSSEIAGGISRLSPNPLARTAEIEYSLPVDCQVTLGVYDIQGQRVAILMDEPHSAGRSVAHWMEGHGWVARPKRDLLLQARGQRLRPGENNHRRPVAWNNPGSSTGLRSQPLNPRARVAWSGGRSPVAHPLPTSTTVTIEVFDTAGRWCAG